MTKIKFALLPIFVTLLFAVSAVFASAALAAPRLYLDPATVSTTKNSQFEVKVQIDVESQSAFGSGAFVNFTPADLRLDSVTKGDFFSDLGYSTPAGRVELQGYFSGTYDSKSGAGTFATLKFTVLKESVTSNITFTCTGTGNDTQILNYPNGNNILTCGSLNQSIITVAGGATATATATATSAATGTATATATPGTSTTKSCAGTCSSGNDCKAGLYCYQGICRNPACGTDTDCNCDAAATPTPKGATTKPKATKKPVATPQVVVLTPYTSPTPEAPVAEVTPEPVAQKEVPALSPLLIFVGAVLGVLALIFFLVSLIRRRSSVKPPFSGEVKPPLPDNPPPTTPGV